MASKILMNFRNLQVERVNLRDWTIEEVQSMINARSDFDSVYLDGFIYAIGGVDIPSRRHYIER